MKTEILSEKQVKQIDYSVLKQFSKKELLNLLPGNGFRFKTEPWDHQLAALIATLTSDGFNIWLDLGIGKSKVAIDAMRYFEYRKKRKSRTLVVCLNSAIYKWKEEIEMHSDIPAFPLVGNAMEKFQLLDSGPGFYIVNYEGLRSMLTRRVPRPIKFRNGVQLKRTNKEVMDRVKMDAFYKLGFDGIVIDESHKVKNPNALTFKIISAISLSTNKRMLLTGTPFGKQLLDLWAQYYITDRGETFFSNYRKFVLEYFEDKGYFGEEWHVTDIGRETIELLMFDRAIRYSEKEVKGLPPKIYRTLNFELTPKQSLDYNHALKRVEEFKDIVNRTMVFRQICSGIIVKNFYKYKENPKLDLLKDFLDSIVYDSKVVIFHEFILENEIIAYMLKRQFKDIRFSQLNGKVKNKWAEIKAFQNDDRVRVMLAHPQSGGASIDLNIAHYCIFFSNNHDPISRSQCEKRIHRGMIKNRRFFYDLVARGTVEVGMHKALRANENFFKSIMNKDELIGALKGGTS